MNQKFIIRTLIKSLALFIILSAIQSWTYAQSDSQDRYAPVYEKQPKPESLSKRVALHWPVYPFELIKYPVDKGLVYVEKHHLDQKAKWIYEKITDYGLKPDLNVISATRQSYGADFDFVRMLRQRANFPDLTAEGWIKFAQREDFDVGATLGSEQIGGTGLYVFGYFDYDDKPAEHFYGIGPHTSAGDGSVYNRETTTLDSELGYSWTPTLDTSFKFGYQNVNISDGKDGSRAQIGQHPTFSEERIQGFHGDDLLHYKVELLNDMRNLRSNSTRGGYQRLSFSFNEGVGGSPARFLRYETEIAQYQRLWSDRRILAFHFYGEYNSELNNHTVPFHQMPMLGEFGAAPILSHPLRGFDFNRFTDKAAALFNLEYRYKIWEYKEMDMQSVIFLDSGQVFPTFGQFQFHNFRESYGLGFRIHIANVPILSLETAHGDEGTKIYVKSSAPF